MSRFIIYSILLISLSIVGCSQNFEKSSELTSISSQSGKKVLTGKGESVPGKEQVINSKGSGENSSETNIIGESNQLSYLELTVGGNFQNTDYRIKNDILDYTHTGLHEESVTGVTINKSQLDTILSQYNFVNFDAKKNEAPNVPDALYYVLNLTIGERKYSFICHDVGNDCSTLSKKLILFFDETLQKHPTQK